MKYWGKHNGLRDQQGRRISIIRFTIITIEANVHGWRTPNVLTIIGLFLRQLRPN